MTEQLVAFGLGGMRSCAYPRVLRCRFTDDALGLSSRTIEMYANICTQPAGTLRYPIIEFQKVSAKTGGTEERCIKMILGKGCKAKVLAYLIYREGMHGRLMYCLSRGKQDTVDVFEVCDRLLGCSARLDGGGGLF